MEKNRFIKTALCLVLAFAMTFVPIFSSYAMIATALVVNEGEVTEEAAPADNVDEAGGDEAEPEEDSAPAEETAEDTSSDAAQAETEAETPEQPSADNGDVTVQEPESKQVEAEDAEEATKTVYEWKDTKVKVTAKLSDASIIPDDAELVVKPINKDSEDYNYDAYMDALNKDSQSKYDEKNTLLYDIAFIKDGVELQPESGKVSVSFEFLDNQLAESIGAKKAADVNVIHLPLTDEVKEKYDTTADATNLDIDDISVDALNKKDNKLSVNVKEETVEFDLDSFSAVAFTAAPLLGAASDTVSATLNFYDEAGTTNTAFNPSTGDQFALLVVIQDENNRYPAYALQEINPRGQDSMTVSVSEFTSLTPVTHDDGTISYTEGEQVTYTAAGYPNVRVRLIHYPAGTVNNFNDIMKQDTTSSDIVEGYAFMGSDSPHPSSSNSNPAEINMKQSFTRKEYAVRLTFDPEGTNISSGDHYYVFVQRDHTSGDKTYFLQELTTSASDTEKEILISDGMWKDDNGNPAQNNQNFTGQEKNLTVRIIKADQNINMRQAINQNNCAVIADGGTVKVYTVQYPSGGSKWIDRMELEEDYANSREKYVDVIKLTKNDVTNEYDYRSILGPGIGYGITADRLEQGGSDFQSNFAVNNYKDNGNGVNPNLSGGSAGYLAIGNYVQYNGDGSVKNIDPNGKVFIGSSLNNAPIVLYTDKESRVRDHRDFVTVVPTSPAEVASKIVEPTISHMERISNELASHSPTVTPIKTDDKVTIDTTAYPDGATIYVDADALDAQYGSFSNGSPQLRISKKENQTIIFNFNRLTDVQIKEYSVRLYDADGRLLKDGNSAPSTGNAHGDYNHQNTLVDNLSKTVVWNLKSAHNVSMSSTAGTFLIPDETSKTIIETTSSGWIISDGYIYNKGEWHFVWAGLNDWDTVEMNAIKTLDNKTPASDKKFVFEFSHWNSETNKWDSLKKVENDGSSVFYRTPKPKTMEERFPDGWHVFSIKEDSVASSTTGSYTLDTRTYYYVAKFTTNTSGGNTVQVAAPVGYFTDFDESKFSPTAASYTEFVSGPVGSASFVNTTNNGKINIKVKKNFEGVTEWGESDSFKFTITDKNGGAPIPEKTTVEINKDTPNKTASFGDIIFTEPGVYEYEIREIVPEDADKIEGVTYDEGVYTATVNVIESNGKLTTDVVYKKDSKQVAISDNTVPFTNTKEENGTIEISKKVVSNVPADENQLFTFTIELTGDKASSVNGVYDGVNFTTGKATIQLKHNQSKKITGLPAGLSYKIVEATVDNMTPSYKIDNGSETAGNTAEGTIAKDSKVDFTNTREEGDLEVSKSIISSTLGDLTKNFNFTVTLKDASGAVVLVNGKFGDMTFTDGVAEFTLTNNQTKKAEKLPAGLYYTVTEASADGFTLTAHTGDKGVISKTETSSASFTNTRDEGGLVVSKTVKSDITADHSKEFSFKVTLQGDAGAAINGKYGDLTFKNGVAEFKLTDNQQVSVTGLPNGLKYEVEETRDNDFVTTINGKTTTDGKTSGTITKSGTANEQYVNARKDGDLKISKDVVSKVPADLTSKFTFTIELKNRNQIVSGTFKKVNPDGTEADITFNEEGKATVELQHNQSVTIKGLPVGTTYSVVEAEATHFATEATGKTGTITETLSEAKFKNTRNSGQLKISKSVVSKVPADETKEFTFTIQLMKGATAENSINGEFDITPYKGENKVVFVNGKAKIDVQGGAAPNGNARIIFGLPAGISYEVVEAIDNDFVTTSSNTEGTIPDGGIAAEAAFTNTKKTGGLKVSKTVTSSTGSDKNKKFEFTVTLDSEAHVKDGTYGGMTFTDGVAKFELSDGEHRSADELPKGVSYTVEEKTEEGFIVTWTGKTEGDDKASGEIGDSSAEGYVVPEVAFTNKAIEGDTSLKATKSINNWGKAESFTFRLTPITKNAPMPGNAESVDKDATKAQTTVDFGQMHFTKVGVYEYQIQEQPPEGGLDQDNKKDGITYDVAPHRAVITVTDTDGDGNLEFDIKYDTDKSNLTITNTYAAAGKATIQATKTFNDWGKAEKFTFNLTAKDSKDAENKTIPANKVPINKTSADATKDTAANFGEITYTEPGTYNYEITEVVPAGVNAQNRTKDGITYDVTPKQVVVTVTDPNKDGNLVCKVTYDGAETTAAEFINAYDANGETELKAQKSIEGRTFQNGDKWTFTVTAPEGTPMPERPVVEITPTAGDKVAVDFGKISYGLDHAGHTYDYTITESGNIDGVENDTVKTVSVTVTDGGKGELVITKVPTDENGPTFTNKYSAKGIAELEATKTFNDWGAMGAFEFILTPVDGAPMPKVDGVEQTSVTKNVSKNVPLAKFGEIEYTKEGTFYYNINEVLPEGVNASNKTKDGITYDTDTHVVKVVVSENTPKNGKLNAVVTYDDKQNLEIKNKYEATGEAKLEVTKKINNWGNAEKFTFELTAKDSKDIENKTIPAAEVPMPDKNTAEATKADVVAKFGTINYTQPGTYKYSIKEVVPKGDKDGVFEGITYDRNEYEVVVTVTDNKTGTLETTVSYEEDTKLDITNTYNASGKTSINGIKHMDNRNFRKGDSFTFTIEGVDGAPIRGTSTVTIAPENGTDCNFTFGDWTYTLDDLKDGDTYLKTKTFTYTITETATIKGVTNDSAKTLVVTVTDNGKGTLQVEHNYEKTPLKFVNTYGSKGETTLGGTKVITGREFQEDDEWTFTVECDDPNAPMPEKTSVTIKPTKDYSEEFSFGKIRYTIADAGKTYTYTIRETGQSANVKNDTAKTVTVKITDDGSGNGLTIETSTQQNPLIFRNEYTAKGEITVNGTKTIENRDFLASDTWTFTMTAEEEGAPLPENNPVVIRAEDGQEDAEIKFGKIKYDLSDVGKTYHYTITETGTVAGVTNDKNVHTFTVTVAEKTGKKDGELIVTKVDGKFNENFINTYDAEGKAKIEIEKKLSTGVKPEAGAYEFALLDKDGKVIEEKVTNDANGKVSFKELTYKLKDAGKEFDYTIVETSKAKSGWTNASALPVKVEVGTDDDFDGKFETEVKFEDDINYMTNKYRAEGYAELFATKSLTGRDLEKDQFTFELKEVIGTEEKVIDTVSNDDNGLASFKKINYVYDPAENKDDRGNHTYKISEKKPEIKEGDIVSDDGNTINGITYDTSEKTITVSVTDDEKGNLVVKYNQEPIFAGAAFSNTYDAEGSGKINGVKKVFENGTIEEGQFTFSVYQVEKKNADGTYTYAKDADGNAIVAATGQSESSGNIKFTDLSYKLKDIADGTKIDGKLTKTFKYVIKEDVPAGAEVTSDGKFAYDDEIIYDLTEHEFDVTVTDNGNGTLDVDLDEDLQIECKNKERFTKLQLTKNIDEIVVKDTKNNETEELTNVTCFFKIKYTDPMTGKAIERTVSVQFDPKKVTAETATVEKIPFDAKVEVEEVYAADYTTGEKKKGAALDGVDKDTGIPYFTVTFDNSRHGDITGSGVINTVDKDTFSIKSRRDSTGNNPSPPQETPR